MFSAAKGFSFSSARSVPIEPGPRPCVGAGAQTPSIHRRDLRRWPLSRTPAAQLLHPLSRFLWPTPSPPSDPPTPSVPHDSNTPMPTPRAIARLAALRGFAWSDEVHATPGGDCPVLAPNGAELGRLDVSQIAPTVDEDSGDADSFNLFDTIEKLDDAERTSLFEQLEDAELSALASILSSSEFDLPDVVAEHLETSPAQVTEWVAQPTPQLLRARRRARVELLQELRSHYSASDERTIPSPAKPELERIRQLRGRLFSDSIRLASVVASKHRRHLSFETALLAACRGLVVAMDRFEPTRGNKFSTYAIWWVRQHVTRVRMDRGNALRVPVHVSDKLSVFYGRERELWSETGIRPTPEAVLKALEPSRRGGDLHFEQLRPVLRAHLSREEHVFPAYGEVVVDPSVLPLFEGGGPAPWVHSALDEVDLIFSRVRGRQAETMAVILQSRLGLRHPRQLTLQELGDRFGVSRERVRQLETKALTALKARELEGFSDDPRPWDWSAPR